MPKAPPTPCTHPGCPEYATRRSRCDAHQRIGWAPDSRRGSRQSRGYGARWERLREWVLRRDQYVCQACRRDGRLTSVVVGQPSHPHAGQVDHIRPKARGGTDDEANLETLCRTCHQAKTARER